MQQGESTEVQGALQADKESPGHRAGHDVCTFAKGQGLSFRCTNKHLLNQGFLLLGIDSPALDIQGKQVTNKYC